MSTKTKSKVFPKEILVHIEEGDNATWLVANRTIEDAAPAIGEQRKVARYGLIGVSTWTAKAVEE